MKKISFPFELNKSWQFISSSVIILSFIGLLLFTQLNTLVPGYSASEQVYVDSTSTPAAILDDPTFLPHKAISFGFRFLTHDNYLSARLASVTIGAAAILVFYFCASRWYSRHTAFLASIMFATSSWFLHISRVALPDIAYPAALLAVIALFYLMKKSTKPLLAHSLLVLAIGASIYLPGFILLIIPGLFLVRKAYTASISKLSKKQKYILGTVYAAAAAPLIFTTYFAPKSLVALLGYAETISNIVTFAKQAAYVPLSVFGRTPGNPEVHLGHLPYLDIVSVAFLLLGLYFFIKYRYSLRSKLIATGFLSGSLLSALATSSTNAILLPIIFLTIAAGLSVVISYWLAVFPKNPLAKSFGILLVTLVVMSSVVYNLRNYYIAWPQTPATKDAYSRVL